MNALRVLAHPDDFLPTYNRLQSQPQISKAMLEAINNVKQQLERSDKPLGAHLRKSKFHNIAKHAIIYKSCIILTCLIFIGSCIL